MADLAVISAHVADPDPSGARLVRVRVRNETETHLHVSSELSAMTYDADSSTLSIEFGPPAERDPGPGIRVVSTHPLTPHQVVVGPGAVIDLETMVPASLHPYNRVGGLTSVAGTAVRIGAVDVVHVRVGSSPQPFQPSLDLEPSERIRQMAAQAHYDQHVVAPAHVSDESTTE